MKMTRTIWFRVPVLFAAALLAGCGYTSGIGGPVRTLGLTLNPGSGPVGTLITVSGTDFSTASSVTIGGAAAVLVSSSSTSVSALVMPGTSNGPIGITTGSATYLSTASFTVTATGVPATQQGTKLVGTDATAASNQGSSVAVSADGNTVLIGALNDNSGAGAARVFTRSGSAWTQQGSALVGTGATGTANQGIAVALSADGNTALVGGTSDNASAGAAWIFTRSGGVWSQQGAKLTGSGAIGSPTFGHAVALSADGNTALIGGSNDNSAAGAVWIFTRSGGVWTPQGAKLVGSGAVGNARQGVSVALSADGNTALVGGYNDSGGVGAAWVFTRSGGSWSQQGAKLTGTGNVGASSQGWSVALSAGGDTALVGGFTNNSGTGAAWIFTRSAGSWTQQGSALLGTGATGAAHQGSASALSADGNTALVGGYADNSNAGAVWVFTRAGGSWTQQGAKLVGNDATGTANQGGAIALSADGFTAIIGGEADNSNAGAAWIWTP